MAVRNFGGTSVLTELRQRGVQDVYVASMDGSKGLPEAVNAVRRPPEFE
nr:transposase [Xanthomonas oryzae]